MATKLMTAKEIQSRMGQFNARLFFCGGYGGLVTYDGKGGPMYKEGSPIDRLFLLRNDFKFAVGALTIQFGAIKFITGPLAQPTTTIRAKGGNDTTVNFVFEGNSDPHAVEIRGSIPELDIPRDTILFHANVEPSLMKWTAGDVSHRHPMLPYVAYHTILDVHPAILKSFGVVGILGASTGWPKAAPDGVDFTATPQGAAFRAQQQLGLLSVYCQCG